jgi:outer membrane lipopolysaccharide assembly protein LptE/RlpB
MSASKNLFIYFGILLLCSLLQPGCGYHRAMPVNPLLQNISTIAVPYFKNKTFEPELESIFMQAFVNEFIESKRLQVVSREQADVILYGTIKQLLEDTISYDSDDKAQEYRLRVSVDLVLEERQTGKVVWKRTNLQHAEEYTVDTSISASEAIKREALQRLTRDLAERVHDSIMQGF